MHDLNQMFIHLWISFLINPYAELDPMGIYLDRIQFLPSGGLVVRS